MPFSADRFDEIDDETDDRPSPSPNPEEIFTFLEDHPEQAFTQSEIALATEVIPGLVGPTLVRLWATRRVDHRGTYWRISDHAQSVDAATGHTAAVAACHEDTPLDYDEWQEHAVDPRDTRE